MTIRKKLTLWYSGLLGIIVILFSIAVYTVISLLLIDSVDRTLEATAEQVRQNSRVSWVGEFGGPSDGVVFLPRLDIFRASGVGVQVWVVNEEEPRLADTSANLDFTDPLDPHALGTAEPHFRTIIINDQEGRVLTRPMFARGQLFANIQVVAPMDTVNTAQRHLLLVIFASGVLALGGSVILGLILSRQALRPIEGITAAAASIAQTDDLSTRLPWSGPMDELGRLTSVFNQMMERLQDLFSVQQRFVADVSHELRTPLTAIRGNLDLIKRYGMDDMSMEAIESEVDRMARMVNDLLLLARADYGGLTLDLEPLDLDGVVIDAYNQAQVLVKDRDLTVRIQHIEPVRINGHPDRVMQLLLNLLSNAIKFTPDGGSIELELRQQGADAILKISDTGIGISEADQKHIFDRFYQADTSRMRTGDSSGLGLAIVKWIVEAHHGRVCVASQLGEGTTFTVTLPIHQENHSNGSDEADRRGGRLSRLLIER